MTQILAEVPETPHAGDGATVSFLIGFALPTAGHLAVTIDGVAQTAGADFNVVGSNVVFVEAPAVDAAIEFRRVTPVQQMTEFPTQPTMVPRAVEQALNERALAHQEDRAKNDRSMTSPIGETGLALPVAAKRRGKLLAFSDTPEAYPLAAPSDLAQVAADLDRSEAARDVSQAQAAIATTQAAIATTQAGVATAQAGIATAQAGNATTQAGLAEAFVAALVDNGSYETDAEGRTAVAVDGKQYYLRTADGARLRTRVNSTTSADWLDSTGAPFIVATTNGVRRRRNFVMFKVVDDGLVFNNYAIQPGDPKVDLNTLVEGDLWGTHTIPKTNTVGSGSVSVEVRNGDGTPLFTRQFIKPGKRQMDLGEHVEGDSVQWRILTTAEDAGLRMMQLVQPDRASKSLTRLNLETGPLAQLTSPDRPVKYGKIGANAYYYEMRPPPGAYFPDAGHAKHTDKLFGWIYDMGTFQSDPPSLTYQGFGSDFAQGGLDETCNLLFMEIDGGVTTNNGSPPSTYEGVPFGGSDALNPAVAANFPAAGRGHGFQLDNVDTVTLMRNDVSTARVITAVSLADPLVITLTNAIGLAAGDRMAFRGVVGTTQLNGLEMTVSSVDVGAKTLTFDDVDATGWTAFVSHGGSIDRFFDLTEITVPDGFRYGDQLKVNSTCLLHGNGGAAEVWCRAYYDRTIEPNAAVNERIDTRFDATDPAVNVVPVLKRAILWPWPIRNVNRMMVRRAGAWDPTVYEIDKRDGTVASYGKAEALLFWHTTNDRRINVVMNLLGYGVPGDPDSIYSHWEDDGGGRVNIPMTFAGYVHNNAWGPKVNDGQIDYGASVRNIEDLQFGSSYGKATFTLKPGYSLADFLVALNASGLLPGVS